jgi:transposase
MSTKLRYVAMDVHKASITIAVAEQGRDAAKEYCTVPNDPQHVFKALARLGAKGKLRCCYEAGPTGYELHRALKQRGIDCIVVAPSLVPIQAGNRVKTDRRDAVKLAHFLRSGDLTAVYVPDEATEALRDLERARDDAKCAERVARHQLSKFLLRHGRRFSDGGAWTQKHLAWIRTLKFAHEAQQRVLCDYLKSVEDATARVDALTKDIAELVETTTLAPLVKALQALRGVRLVTAVTIAAELGDLKRFATPRQLMAFLGLVPSEHSSGESKRRGRITRTGNTHVRRVLVEAAWSYQFRPNMSQEIRKRNEGIAPGVQRIAWQAQQRLHKRLMNLRRKGKNTQKAIIAVARELAGFVWAIGQEQELLAA